MRTFACIAMASFLTSAAFCQRATNTAIRVFVEDEGHHPLEGAVVLLQSAKDSLLIKTAVADNKGIALFEQIPNGAYLAKASHVNHFPRYSDAIIVSDAAGLPAQIDLVLGRTSSDLKTVTLDAARPFIQKKTDRIVVNVQNSIISAGSSIMEVLERSPGVNVDQNDVISLRGKQGVIIMLDGKPTPMTGNDLASYLKGLPSGAVDRIDIISNPSARFDAAGNAGIIDIHMKKDQRLGINGTITGSLGQGVYSRTNEGLTFNYRNAKLNIFGNYNYAYRKGLNHLVIDRNFYTNNQFEGEDKKDNYTTFPSRTHVIRFGMDYAVSKKTIIGFVSNSSLNHFAVNNDNHSTVLDKKTDPSYTFQTRQNGRDRNNNIVTNVNLKHTFDSTGQELTADIDYGIFDNRSTSNTATDYFKLDGSALQPNYILLSNQKGKLTLKTAKADYTLPMKHGPKLEAGIKTSAVTTDNDVVFNDLSTGVPVNDTTKTNHFLYSEYNNAAYANLSQDFGKYNAQVGIRGEHTRLKTFQEKGALRFDSSYLQLFPSAFFNYKINKDQTVGLSVSRRIDRPGYSQLNPFLFLIDVSTYATGNTALLPQLTWSYELNYSLKNLNFSFNYSHTKDVMNIAIAKFRDVFPNSHFSDSNITVEIPVNLISSNYFGISISAPFQITSWWNMNNNGNFYHNHFKGDLGGTMLNNGSFAVDLRSDNTISFHKKWKAELNGVYNSGGRDGYEIARPQWTLSTGIQKLILQDKGTLRANITDIFRTSVHGGTITYPGKYLERWLGTRDTRIATLSFTYRFGKNTVQGARSRSTGSEEERQRAQ